MIFLSPSSHLVRGCVCPLLAPGMRSGRVLQLDLSEDEGQIMGLLAPWMLKQDDRGLVRLGMETVWIVEEDTYASQEAWAHSIGLSQTVHHELQTYHDHAELLALRGQQRARQPGPDARILDHQDASGDADSHI
ncbi:hypothetical protein Tco_0468457 [Tanacetum coccineum]